MKPNVLYVTPDKYPAFDMALLEASGALHFFQLTVAMPEHHALAEQLYLLNIPPPFTKSMVSGGWLL